MNDKLEELYGEKLSSIHAGKEVFDYLIGRKRRKTDKYILVLTNDSKWLKVASELYPEMKTKCKGKVYVISEIELAGVGKGEMIECDYGEIRSLADYFALFTEEYEFDEEFVYLVDDDTYGSNVKELMKMNEISIEEYVRSCVLVC